MPYSLDTEQDRKILTDMIEQWIVEDEAAQSERHTAWNKIDDRLGSEIQISNFSQDYISDLQLANDPKTAEAQKNKQQFVTINRARPNHESVLGDFVNKRRKLDVSGATPKDRNLATVLRKRMEYIENSEMLPEMVYFPAFDNSFSKGLDWIEVRYNPKANMLKGKFEVKEVNCRDVLVDSHARGLAFMSAGHVSVRFQKSVKEAVSKFRKYPAFGSEDLAADNDYHAPYGRMPNTKEDFATFYRVQFKESICHYYLWNEQSGELEEIDELLYEELSANEATADLVVDGDEEDVYYEVLYHKTKGAFSLEQLDYGMFTLIPVIGIHSDGQLYPIGDVEIYANLLDLLDVLITVFLENAKKANIPIVEVDEAMYERFQQEIDDALQGGGAAPGIKGVHYAQSINAALIQLIPWVLGWIQDSVSKHAASMGELPTKQIAKETVQALIAKDRQAHGRKDVMIGLALTQLAKLLSRMISQFDDDADFFQVTDARPGQIGYIPVNQRWLEEEYMQNLKQIANLPDPQTPEEAQMLVQQLQAFRQQFEMENDVDIEEVDGYIVPLAGGPKELRGEELGQLIQQSGISEQDFVTLYQPQQAKLKQYVINDLSKDVDLNIRYTIDTDYENDPEYRANRAVMMANMGKLSTIDLFKELRMSNPEELIKNLDSENQALALAKAISSRPDIAQVVQALLAKGQAQPQQEKVAA